MPKLYVQKRKERGQRLADRQTQPRTRSRYDIYPEDRNEPRLRWDQFQWRPTGNGNLEATMKIGDANFIVTAYQIREIRERRIDVPLPLVRLGTDPDQDGEFTDRLWRAHGMDGWCEYIEMDGVKYAIFICPFCTDFC